MPDIFNRLWITKIPSFYYFSNIFQYLRSMSISGIQTCFLGFNTMDTKVISDLLEAVIAEEIKLMEVSSSHPTAEF